MLYGGGGYRCFDGIIGSSTIDGRLADKRDVMSRSPGDSRKGDFI